LQCDRIPHSVNILLFSTSCSAKPRVLNSPSHRYLAICNAMSSTVIGQVNETREVKVKLFFLNRFWNMPALWSISVTWATKLCLFLESLRIPSSQEWGCGQR